jgi:hypothetical protein
MPFLVVRSLVCRPMMWYILTVLMGGRDSAVEFASCYGLDGPGFEPSWGAKFSVYVLNRPPKPTYPSVKCIPCLFPNRKAAGAWR